MAIIRQKGLPQNPRRRAFNTQGVQRTEPVTNRGFTQLRAPDRTRTQEAPARDPRKLAGSASGLSGRSFDPNNQRRLFGGVQDRLNAAGSAIGNAIDVGDFGRQMGAAMSRGDIGLGGPAARRGGPSPTTVNISEYMLEADKPLAERLGIPRIDWDGFDIKYPRKWGGGTINPVNKAGSLSQFLVEEATRPSTLAIALGGAGLRAKAMSASARLSATATARAARIRSLKNAIAQVDPLVMRPESQRLAAFANKEMIQNLNAKKLGLQIQQGFNAAGRGGLKATSMVVEPIDSIRGAGIAGRFAVETGMATGARSVLEPVLDSDLPIYSKAAFGGLGLLAGGWAGGAAVGQVVRKTSKSVAKYQDAKSRALLALTDFELRHADGPITSPIDVDPDAPRGITGIDVVEFISPSPSESSAKLMQASRSAHQYMREHAWEPSDMVSLTRSLERDKVMLQMGAGKWQSVEFENMPIIAGSGKGFAENLFAQFMKRKQRATYLTGREQRFVGELLDTEIEDPDAVLRLANIERSRAAKGTNAQEAQFRGRYGAVHKTQDPQSTMFDYSMPEDGSAEGMAQIPMSREEIPDEMYHVSTDWPSLQKAGRISATTRGLRKGLGEGRGLGGGETNAVSVTDSKEMAEHILREFKRINKVQTVTTPEQFYAQIKQIIKEDAQGLFSGKETLDDKGALWEYIVRFMHNSERLGNKPPTKGASGTIDGAKTQAARGLSAEELRNIASKSRYDGHIIDQLELRQSDTDAPPRQMFGINPQADDDQLLDEFVKLVFPEDDLTRSLIQVQRAAAGDDPVVTMRSNYINYLEFRDTVGRREANSGMDYEDIDATREWMEESGVGFINPNFLEPDVGWTPESVALLKNSDPNRYGIEVIKKEQIPDARGQRVRKPRIEDVQEEFITLKQTPTNELTDAQVRVRDQLPDNWDDIKEKHIALLETQISPTGRPAMAGDPTYRDPSLETAVTRIVAAGDILREIQIGSDIPLGTVVDQVFTPKTTLKLRDVIMENGQVNPIVKELGLLRMHETGENAGQYFWSERAQPWADAIGKLQKDLDTLRSAEESYGIATKDVIGEDLADIPEEVVKTMTERWNNVGPDGRNAPMMPYFGDVVERTNGVNHYFPRFVVGGPDAQLSGNINSLRGADKAVAESIKTSGDQTRATGWDVDGYEYQRQMFENIESFKQYTDEWDKVAQKRIVASARTLEYLGNIEEVMALRFKSGFNRINAQWTRNQLLGETAGMGGKTLNQRIRQIPAFAKVIKLKKSTTDQYRDLVDSFQDLPEYLSVRREILNDARARLKGMPPEEGAQHLQSLDPLGAVERGIAREMVPELDRLVEALKQLPRAAAGRTGKPIKKYVKNVYELEATAKRLKQLGNDSDRASSTVLDPKNVEELIELNELAAKQYQAGWNTFDSQLRNKPTLRRQLEAATGRTMDETEREFLDNMDTRELANTANRFEAVQQQLDVMDGYYTRLGIDTHSVAGEDMRALVDEGIRIGRAKAQEADAEFRRIKAIAGQPIDAVEIRTPFGRQGNRLATGRNIPSTQSGAVKNTTVFPNRYWDEEFLTRWEQLNAPALGLDKTTKMGKLYGKYVASNNLGRAINAAMDLSAFGINGLYLMGASPVVAARSYWRVIESLTVNPNAWADYMAENDQVILEMARKGVYWGAESDTGEFLFPSKLEKVFNWGYGGESVNINGQPFQYGEQKTFGLGKAFQISNIAFSRTGNVIRTEMFKQMYKNQSFLASLRKKGAKAGAREALIPKDKFKDLSDPEWNDIVDTINKATGFSQGGEYSELAGPIFFAPRYMMAQIGFLQKAAVGRGVGANKARDLLLRTAATMGLATELTNRSQGLETDWNPVLVNDDGSVRPNPSFFKAYIGGHTVSFLGPLDSMIRTLSYIAMDPVEGFQWAAKSKSAPMPSMLTEIIEGKTFSGEPVDYWNWFDSGYEGLEQVQYGASTTALAIINQAAGRLPFTFGNVVQDMRDGEMVLAPTKLIAYATNSFGMKAHPTNPYTVLDQAAQRMFDMPYNELRPDDRVAVQEANPKAWYDRNEYAVKMAAFEKDDARKYNTQLDTRKIQEQWWSDQNELMESVYDGTITLSEFNRAYSERNSARIAELAGNTDEVLYGDTSHASDKRKAVDAWYNAYSLADGALGIDFDIVEELQREIMINASLEVREYLQYYFQDDHTTHPVAIRWWLKEGDYVRDSGYYDVASNTWPLTDLGSTYSNILGMDIRSFQDLLSASRTEANLELVEQMERDISLFNGEVDRRKKLMRERNPRLDEALVLYRGLTPSTQQGQEALERFEAQIRQRYTPWSKFD